jgi:hypothetical protein
VHESCTSSLQDEAIVITLALPAEDASFLAQQLGRQLETIENELVHTDVHRMQQELAHDLERLRTIRDGLTSAIADEREEVRSSTPLAP